MAGVDSAEADAILAAPVGEATKEVKQTAPQAPSIAPRRPPKRIERNPADDARAAAAGAHDLQALAAAIAAFDGCALKANARKTVVFDGVADAPVMLIGDAPRKDDDASGLPFSGDDGKLLDRMLGAIGLSRQNNVLLSNLVYWRPAGDRPPTQGEIATCLPFVERAITLAHPKLLILVGNAAAQSILRRTEGVMRMRGKTFDYGSSGLTQKLSVMVMLHPAYLLTRPGDKQHAWRDLLAFEKLAQDAGVTLSAPPY
jgi:DNA polymerase